MLLMQVNLHYRHSVKSLWTFWSLLLLPFSDLWKPDFVLYLMSHQSEHVEIRNFPILHLNTSNMLLDKLFRRHFSEGRYCLSSKLLYLMIQLLLRLSTVHQFEKSFVWLRNLVEVCLKSISLYSDYCVVKVRFYADNWSNYKSPCMASQI